MLKILVFLFLVAAVVLYFAGRNMPRRPPRDWGRGGGDGGPVWPAGQVFSDADKKRIEDTPSGDNREAETVSADSDGDGGDGGGD